MKRLSSLARIAALILAILLLSSCSKGKQSDNIIDEGFNGANSLVSGGGATESDINARSLEVTLQRDNDIIDTLLSFTFTSGSRMSGTTEENSGCGIPAYTVYLLDNPSRLFIRFSELAYWDYRRAIELTGDLVKGTFQYTVFEDSTVNVCFQLSSKAQFKVEENEDVLTIRVRQSAAVVTEQTKYYVTANIYNAYISGSLAADFNASPTYANDMQNILMISPGFDTQELASEYLINARQQHPSLAEDVWQIQELTGNTLPVYDSVLDYITVYRTPVVRLSDGTVTTLPVLAYDGMYLCDLPNGEGFLYSKQLKDEEGFATYEQLVAIKNDGTAAPVTSFDFAAIESAAFSPDNRKLTVLENADGATHLYVFDADTYELLNDLSEMGFGGSTSAYIWNSLGNTIYAITGSSNMQLHQFDYSIPDELQRHGLVDNSSIDEGSLGFYDGELYFVYSGPESSTIYHIKPEGGVKKPFTGGSRFLISPDERYMVIVDNSLTSTKGNNMTLYELATGKETVLPNDFYPNDFIWSSDSTKLYYIQSHISGGQTEGDTSGDGTESEAYDQELEDNPGASVDEAADTQESDTANTVADEYPFTLWVYDIAAGTNTALLDIASANIFASTIDGTFYMNRYEENLGGSQICATYLLDLKAIFEAKTASEADVTMG